MTSAVSISATIDSLIQQINSVNVCQDHWKLVASILTRLRRRVNESDQSKDSGRSQNDIAQTLQTIGEIIIRCSENESHLSKIAYRDLESLLFRLQLRLAQHEVDLTDNYQAKVEILSKVYYEQQILTQKLFEDAMKQRLAIIEQRTATDTKEQLCLLHQKHATTIESYLRCCTELHKSVPLSGVTGNIATKVAHAFYNISLESQVQLERNWQVCELPLTRSFIQFKPDKSTSFEKNESRRLLIGPESNLIQGSHGRREASKGLWQRLVSAPYMMSMVERDRYAEDEDVSEETIIRTNRWIVILGDPGSGKTSFARWLVRHLAQTSFLMVSIQLTMVLFVFQFSFELENSLKCLKKNHHSLYLITLENTNGWDYIEQGQALIILDGLDEIPASNQRSGIISIVESFVEKYIQTLTGVSALDSSHLSKLLDDPSRSGGNQLIVTSRIVGYHAAPLAGQFVHYTIRPMDMEHMKDFVDYWFFRVHQLILDTLDLSIPNQGEDHGKALKKELEKTENAGILDVASNSCLMSFVCTVAFSQLEGSPLPMQRIHLYEEIVNSMLSLWSSKGSTIHVPKLIRILSDIASHIHERSASGLIHEDTMKEVTIQSIKAFLNKKLYTEQDIHGIENQASEFVRIIREDVGILAARGESLYGFLHLTFQEYFTCLRLIDIDKLKQLRLVTHEACSNNKVELVVQSLRCHTNDPRFRVPIALALGKISSTWSQQDFDDFCLKFIQEQNESSAVLPLGAYRIISCGNDLVNYPSDNILFDVMDHLIIAAGQNKWSVVCPFLLNQITDAFVKLRNDTVPLWIGNLLSRSPPHDIQTISALCHLLEGKPHEFENIKWLNQSSCLMLQSLSTLDNENNEFAIGRLLVKIAFSNHRLLSVHPTTFKGFLLDEEIELNSIPTVIFPLIIILYGGSKRDDKTVVFDPSYIYRESTAVTPILVRFLSRRNRDGQDQNIIILKEECLRLLLTRMENHNESPETVDLCIATICLYGIDYVRENVKMISNSLFRMCMNRFKYISMILRQFYFVDDENDSLNSEKVTKFISNMIEKFQYDQSSKVQFLDLLNSLRTSMVRLRSSATSILLEGTSDSSKVVTLYLPNSLRKEYGFLNYILSTDRQFCSGRNSCSLLHYFTKLFWILEHNDQYDTQYRMAVAMDTIPQYLLFRNDEDLLFPLTFIPDHLQHLYMRLLEQRFIMINSKDLLADGERCLFFGHILLECLMLLSSASCKRLSLLAALITLLPMLRIHYLENFGSSLLWISAMKDSDYLSDYENVKHQPMNYETGVYVNKVENFPGENDMAGDERRKLIERCIEEEHQRLRNALKHNHRTNMNLYSACVCLARVCRWSDDKNRANLLEESVQGAMSIDNQLVRLDALCMIGFYCHSDYYKIQVNRERSLHEEIDYQLCDIYSDLPLLLHTTMLIRCLPLLQDRKTVERCLENLFTKFISADQRDQQVVYEALSPYLKSSFALSQVLEQMSRSLLAYNATNNNKSSVLMQYLNNNADENLSNSVLISNLYLAELANDFQKTVTAVNLQLLLSYSNILTIDNPLLSTLFQFEGPILTVTQVFDITNILLSSSSVEQSKKLYVVLNNTLHRFSLVEFKACRLLESWMKWKDSNELYSFAWHAALLLANSDLWSVDAATIICDLLCNKNDRFRHRTEIIFRFKSDDDIRTSSKLGINVLLTLMTRRAHYQRISPSAVLTVYRIFQYTTVDVQSHLDSVLWLERHRIHALANREYSFNKSKSLPIYHAASYFPSAIIIDVSVCDAIRKISNDLMKYMCDLVVSNFSLFLMIESDTTSNAVLESHAQFVVSVLVYLISLMEYDDETRPLMIDALIILFETSENNEIRRAAAHALGYVCDKETSEALFNELQMMVNNETDETSNYSDDVLGALVSSYCHCASVWEFNIHQDAMNLFRKLLKHHSQSVLKVVHVGLGCVLKNSSLLSEMLDLDHIQCYHALIGSTAYVFAYKAFEMSIESAAEFVEQHPDLLPIFVVELYNCIRHFTNRVQHMKTIDYCLAYGYPQYVQVASVIAVQMPAAFCAFIKDWKDGDNLKRALFYTSKQHDYSRRAACLTILSVFGELTVELCEMIIDALYDDPHVQNTCYKCLSRINSVKDGTAVLNLLLSYLKSKSMTVRYATAKLLLHLAQLSLISSGNIRTVLHGLMLDPDSDEDLWLIKEQDDMTANGKYYYAGSLRDVIYTLLVQHLTGDAVKTVRRNQLSDIDSDFAESENAARLASCLYEKKDEENITEENPLKSHYSSSTEHESDEDESAHIDESQEIDNHQLSLEDRQRLVVDVNSSVENTIINNAIEPSIVSKDINLPPSSSQADISASNKCKICVII